LSVEKTSSKKSESDSDEGWGKWDDGETQEIKETEAD